MTATPNAREAYIGIAARLYFVGLALDVAADHPVPRDVEPLIAQGRGLMPAVSDDGVAPDQSVYLLDAGARFLRAWARHAPDEAQTLITGAEVLETGRDLAIASVAHLLGPD